MKASASYVYTKCITKHLMFLRSTLTDEGVTRHHCVSVTNAIVRGRLIMQMSLYRIVAATGNAGCVLVAIATVLSSVAFRLISRTATFEII